MFSVYRRFLRERLQHRVLRFSRYFGNLPLRRKYLFSHIAVVLISIVVLSPASYLIARHQVEKRAGEYSSIILEKSGYLWDAKVDELIDYFLMQFGAYSMGSRLKEDAGRDPALKRLRIERALTEMIIYREGIRFVLIESIDSNCYFAQRDDVDYQPESISSLIPFEQVQQLRAKPFIRTAPDGSILLSKVIYDLQSTRYMGILTVGFDHETFSIVFPGEEHTTLGSVVIIDQRLGQPVIASRGSQEFLGYFIYQNPDPRARQNFEDSLEKNYLVEEVLSSNGRWLLRSYTSIREIAGLSIYAGLLIALATSLALFAAIWFSVKLSNRESRRIGDIGDYARQIAAGDLSGRSLDNHRDELGQLSGTLEDLAHRIAGLVEGLASERARLDEVRYNALQFEYSALQSKINPHFLYNTLEMINSRAKLNGEHDISEIVQLMGELMRDSIRRSNSLITLEEEMEYIGKYLKIQDLINEDSLKVTLDVPEKLRGLLVPNFILQPIVENAISHGIESLNGPGEISIKAYTEGGHLVICVRDNGIGMSEEKIRSVMNREIEETREHAKMGLASVDRRIRIVYDQSCGVRIQSVPGESCSVFLIMAQLHQEKE